jgi:hypothetical protein
MCKAKKTQTQFDTLGIVADLSDEVGREFAERSVRQTNNIELRNLITMADGLNKRYIVAAGRFNGKGNFASFCGDKQTLIAAFQMANARMDEVGSCTTTWFFAPDACRALLENAVAKCNKKKGFPQ